MSGKTFLRFVCGVLLCGAEILCAGEVVLVKEGKAASRIIVKRDAPLPVSFGAKELSDYLEKISGGKLEIASEPAGGLHNVYIGTLADKELVNAAGIKPEQLKEDGFALSTTGDNTLYIIGQNPRGALYGAYEILKKYGGVRWLVPGPDGEYYSRRKTIAVPEQKSIHNPYLKIRDVAYYIEINLLRWMARNNMMPSWGKNAFINPKTGERTPQADLLDSLAVSGVATSGNSHILTNLLGGWEPRNLKQNLERLYLAHPEYFPLIDGKRVLIKDAVSPNPCISNPALLDLMAENLYSRIKGKYGAEAYVTIGNNDTTVWCECDKCRALDNPEKAGTKGAHSDRYWYMVGKIAERIWQKDPAIKLGGWAYQDFWYPPTKVRIDPRLRITVSFNNQCWRHSIQDPKCSVNAELCRIMKEWRKTRLPLIVNRDEISTSGTVGSCYLPSEKVLYDNFTQYPDLGFSGSLFCVPSPFPAFQPWYKDTSPYYGKNRRWNAMWQTCWLSAQFMWDINRDFGKLYEEANRLYYGKAWEGGFKEFKQLQTKCFLETPGCIGWGQGAPLGRCLDQAGVEAKLKALLEKAVNAAKSDPDKRVLAHVLRDKEIFEMTWLAARKEYLQNFKELNIYQRTAPIRIDGVLEEADWKNADVLSGFKPGGHTPKDTEIEQTFVRVLYDTNHLYIAVECMEPHPEKIIAGKDVPRDPTGWKTLGDHIELFYNYPDMADKYYHLAINSKGGIVDARQISVSNRDTSFRTKAQYAVKVLKDRWILEMAIPTSEIGMNCYEGATWKLNVGRQRKIEGLNTETSSCCNGMFHGAANFINIKFSRKRVAGLNQSADPSAWKNGSFDIGIPDEKVNRNYRWSRAADWKFPDLEKLVAKDWNISRDAAGSYRKHEGTDANYYVELEKGYITQYYVSDAPGTIRIQFRARGKGSAALWTASYQNHADKNHKGYLFLKGSSKNHIFKLTPEWKTYTFETKKAGVPTERVAVRFTVHRDSILDLDDCLVYPVEETK